MEAIKQLTGIDKKEIKIILIKHPNTSKELSKEILENLSGDKSSLVRKRVARNPISSFYLLMELLSDLNSDVRVAALDTILNLPDERWREAKKTPFEKPIITGIKELIDDYEQKKAIE